MKKNTKLKFNFKDKEQYFDAMRALYGSQNPAHGRAGTQPIHELGEISADSEGSDCAHPERGKEVT